MGIHPWEREAPLMVDGESLYDKLWDILEEQFVDGPTVDLNTQKGQATMQSAIARIVAAFGDVHSLDLDAH